MSTPLAAALSPLELLREHVGHRCTILEPTPTRSLIVKCVDCTRTVDLSAIFGLRPGPQAPPPAGTAERPARRGIPRLNDPDSCPTHPGQWADTCGPCRSEHLALPDGHTKGERPVGAPPTDDYLAARDALRTRQQAPNDPPPNQETP